MCLTFGRCQAATAEVLPDRLKAGRVVDVWGGSELGAYVKLADLPGWISTHGSSRWLKRRPRSLTISPTEPLSRRSKISPPRSRIPRFLSTKAHRALLSLIPNSEAAAINSRAEPRLVTFWRGITARTTTQPSRRSTFYARFATGQPGSRLTWKQSQPTRAAQ
jgi:hypothetical protein